MSLGKAMIHARKQKSIAKAAALAATTRPDITTFSPATCCRCRFWCSTPPMSPSTFAARAAPLVLVLKGIARTEEEHGLILHAQRARIPMPSVIRLLEYRRIPYQTRALSRKNILLRDRNTCQYCGESAALQRPYAGPRRSRSRGGNSTWENLVACCHPATASKAIA